MFCWHSVLAWCAFVCWHVLTSASTECACESCSSCNAGCRQHHGTPMGTKTQLLLRSEHRILNKMHTCLLPHNSTCWGRQHQLLAAAATKPHPDKLAPSTRAAACSVRDARGCYNTWLLEIQRPCAAAGCNRSAVLHHCCALALEALLLGNCHKAVHLLLHSEKEPYIAAAEAKGAVQAGTAAHTRQRQAAERTDRQQTATNMSGELTKTKCSHMPNNAAHCIQATHNWQHNHVCCTDVALQGHDKWHTHGSGPR